MPTQTSGDLAATGSVTLTKAPADTHVIAAISGVAYGTLTFVFEGTLDDTNYVALAAQRLDTGAVVSGSIAPSDNAEQAWVVAAPGMSKVRARVTAIASGTATFTLASSNFVGLPAVPVNSTSVVATGALTTTSPTAGLGYATGAGGAVTQATSITTGVTLNKATGQVTTVAATTAAAAEDTFTVTNSVMAATDVVVLTTTYAGAGTPIVYCKKAAAGSFDVTISNLHASAALDAALVINFAIVKGVAA